MDDIAFEMQNEPISSKKLSHVVDDNISNSTSSYYTANDSGISYDNSDNDSESIFSNENDSEFFYLNDSSIITITDDGIRKKKTTTIDVYSVVLF